MKPIVIIHVFFLLLTLRPYEVIGEEQTKLLIEGPERVIHVGDVVGLHLTLWPIDDLKEINLKSLEGQKIGNSLVVVTVERPVVSPNNEQAIETSLKGVFIQTKELPKSLTIGDHEVQLLKRSIELTGEIKPIKKLNVFETRPPKREYWPWLAALFVFLMVLIGIYFRKRSRKLRELKAKQAKEEFWKCKLKAAESRHEIEELYAKRKEWSEILRPPSGTLTKFCECIEEIQYKKEWSEEEAHQATQCLSELRRRILM